MAGENERDYYEVLGIPRNASEQDIKRAYRRKAVAYHPDKNPGDASAEENFKLASEAYSVLGDPDKRALYDQYGHSGLKGGGFSGFDPNIFGDFSDILGDLFGFGFESFFGGGARRRSGVRRGDDLRYDLELDFEDAVFGVETSIQIRRKEICDQCGGNGTRSGDSPSACGDCGGAGKVTFRQGFFSMTRTCPRCGGTGRMIVDPCPSCTGSGVVMQPLDLKIKIPAGVDTGSRLRLSGEGNPCAGGGPGGDLYVVIHVREHPFFGREGNHLTCRVPISFSQAALGAEIQLPGLGNDEGVTLKIPAGTQTGSTFSVRGAGIRSLDRSGRGDLYATVIVRTPENLTAEQRKLYQQLAESEGEELRGPGKNIFSRVRDIFG